MQNVKKTDHEPGKGVDKPWTHPDRSADSPNEPPADEPEDWKAEEEEIKRHP